MPWRPAGGERSWLAVFDRCKIQAILAKSRQFSIEELDKMPSAALTEVARALAGLVDNTVEHDAFGGAERDRFHHAQQPDQPSLSRRGARARREQ
jgi:hypothetical protein